jgi:hypothetical protein
MSMLRLFMQSPVGFIQRWRRQFAFDLGQESDTFREASLKAGRLDCLASSPPAVPPRR